MPEITVGMVGKILAKSYGYIKNHRLDKTLIDIENQRNIKIEDLISSDERFSLFARLVRASEVCTSREMMHFLAAYLVNGFSESDVDEADDVFQVAFQRLSELSKSEVILMAEMHRFQVYDDGKPNMGLLSKKYDEMRKTAVEEGKFSYQEIAIFVEGLRRNSFVTMHDAGWSESVPTYGLTDLARYVIKIIHMEFEYSTLKGDSRVKVDI